MDWSSDLFLSAPTYPLPFVIVSSASKWLSAPPLKVAITKSGLMISISLSTWMSAAVTTPSPLNSIKARFGSLEELLFLIASSLIFIIISVTSSFTPGIELNSWRTPLIFTALTAAPGKEDNMILLKELPKVVPYPLSSGSTTKRPYLLSSEISAISILGFSNSNTNGTLLLGN